METTNKRAKVLETLNRLKIVLVLVLLCLVMTILTDKFMTPSNFLVVARQTSVNAIIAMGMSFVLLTGGIDLSVGSIVGFCASISAGLVVWNGMPAFPAIVLGILCGAGIGLLQGMIIAKLKLQPFIVTLAGLTIIRGCTLVFQKGQPITGLGSLQEIGAGYIGAIPIPIILMAIIFAIVWFVQTQTKFSRYIYAIGGNEESARLSGVQTDKVKMSVYGISGALSALAGIIVAARLNSAQPYAGDGYELDAIAAAVIGGVSLNGGKGSALGVIIGAFVIGIINNGLNLLNVSAYAQEIVKGVVILAAVILDMVSTSAAQKNG